MHVSVLCNCGLTLRITHSFDRCREHVSLKRQASSQINQTELVEQVIGVKLSM